MNDHSSAGEHILCMYTVLVLIPPFSAKKRSQVTRKCPLSGNNSLKKLKLLRPFVIQTSNKWKIRLPHRTLGTLQKCRESLVCNP